MPSICFAYDGSVWCVSLVEEAKSKIKNPQTSILLNIIIFCFLMLSFKEIIILAYHGKITHLMMMNLWTLDFNGFCFPKFQIWKKSNLRLRLQHFCTRLLSALWLNFAKLKAIELCILQLINIVLRGPRKSAKSYWPVIFLCTQIPWKNIF